MTRTPFGIFAEKDAATGTYSNEPQGEVVVTWRLLEGSTVRKGDVIATLESDKVESELASAADGVLAALHVADGGGWNWDGEYVETSFGRIYSPPLGEIEAENSNVLKKENFVSLMQKGLSTEEAQNLADADDYIQGAQVIDAGESRVRATPLARKIAKQKGVDLSQVRGTGSGGRVHASDIEKEAPTVGTDQWEKVMGPGQPDGDIGTEKTVRAVPAARALMRERSIIRTAHNIEPTGPNGLILLEDVERFLKKSEEEAQWAKNLRPKEDHEKSLSMPKTPHIRKTIARLLTKSWTEIPHASDQITADATELVEFLKLYKTYSESFSGFSVRLDYCIAWFAACLLKEVTFSTVNVYWDKESEAIVPLPEVNVGVAANTTRGLVIPVVRDSEYTTFAECAARFHEKIEKAKAGRLSHGDLTDLTCTINNTGALGGENPKSILPYTLCSDGSERPTSILINLAKMYEKDGRLLIPLVLVFDHRPLDGELPMAFLRALRKRIEAKHSPEEFAEELFKK